MNAPDESATVENPSLPADPNGAVPIPSAEPDREADRNGGGNSRWPDPTTSGLAEPQNDQFDTPLALERPNLDRAPTTAPVESTPADSEPAEQLVEWNYSGAVHHDGVLEYRPLTGVRVGQESTSDDSTVIEPRTARLSRLGCIVVFIAVIVGRYVFAADRTIYQLAPDEPGSLAMARFLSGGVRFNMFNFNTWRPGLAVLLAPVNAITDDPVQLMHAAYLINAALAAVAAIQLARLAIRLTSLPPWVCLFASATIALSASSLSASAHAWAESLVTVSTLWLISALIRFFDEPKMGPAISASTAVAVGVLSHGRLLPLLPVMGVMVIFGFARQRRFDRIWIWGLYTAAVTAGVVAFTNWVFAEVWESPGGTNTIGTVVEHLADLPGLALSLVGQLWYQLVATFGVFGVGTVILVRHSWRRTSSLPLVRDARVVLLVTLPLVFTSIAFMAGRTRTDHRIYGRYNDAIVWPVLIVGIGWLVSRVRWTRRVAMWFATATVTVGTGALVAVFDGEAMADSVGVRPMIAGFLPIVGTSPDLNPWLLTGAGVGGSLVVFWLLRRRSLVRFTVTLTVVLLVIGGYRTHNALATRLNSWAKAGAVVEIDQIVGPDVPLAFRFVPDGDKPAAPWVEQRRRGLLYQVYLPNHAFERDREVGDGGSPYVFAPIDDPDLIENEATLVWKDPTVKVGLWVEQGAPYTPPIPPILLPQDQNETVPRN